MGICRMPCAEYTFSAAAASSQSESTLLHVIIQKRPPHIAPGDTDSVLRDLVNCMIHSGWKQIARVLKKLPYTYNNSDTITLTGPVDKHKRIIQLLAPYQGKQPHI